MGYANIRLKEYLCDFVVHYNGKVYKCNKKKLYLNNSLLGIFLNVISIRYIQIFEGPSLRALLF